MPTIDDPTLGKITITRYVKATSLKARVAPNGHLKVSAPRAMPLFLIKQSLKKIKPQLLEMLDQQRPPHIYKSGDSVGKSHSIFIKSGNTLRVRREGLRLILTLPEETVIGSLEVQNELRRGVIDALRREARGYLPRRLDFLAQKHGFSYKTVKFSHAGTHWGTCKPDGTITLNIALMKLPFDLIDYVIIHELAHTVHANHGQDFWKLVAKIDPNYKQKSKKLKLESTLI